MNYDDWIKLIEIKQGEIMEISYKAYYEAKKEDALCFTVLVDDTGKVFYRIRQGEEPVENKNIMSVVLFFMDYDISDLEYVVKENVKDTIMLFKQIDMINERDLL